MTRPSRETRRIRYLLHNPPIFASQLAHIDLRPYQEHAYSAVLDSVIKQRGLTFVWIFPRQSGKDEALAHLVQFLLVRSMDEGGEIVFFNPTFTPQTEISMRRLETRLHSNLLLRGRWHSRHGYLYQMGKACCTFMSADPDAHIVSATANQLLVVNEAQDIEILKYDKDIHPMTASTNATCLLSGTRWTGSTLLEREYRFALEAEKQDGRPRVFLFTADDVRKWLPAYGTHVDALVARLGRQHPLLKTQYFCEEIDAQAGMFPPGRQALMLGSHSARTEPEPGKMYCFLIDVAGQDENSLPISALACASTAGTGEMGRAGEGRDSTALKIVEIDLGTVPLLGKPSYKVVLRRSWIGAKHVAVFAALRALASAWRPQKIVIDATGVGEGLWSLLDNAFGSHVVLPVKFTSSLKSELGYGFLGIVESGRYQEYSPFDQAFRLQLDHALSEIVPGPAKLMRWGVPDGTRDFRTGELVHDDDLIASALCVLLDRQKWSTPLPDVIVPGQDPLDGMGNWF